MTEYSPNFNYAVNHTLRSEGGGALTNDRFDPGGKTKYGITEAVAKKHGYDVKKLTEAQAIEIYFKDYWLHCKCDRVSNKFVAGELFDTAVNVGNYYGVYCAQLACNLMGEAIAVDGASGSKTTNGLNALSRHYLPHLLQAMNLFQGIYYLVGVSRFKEIIDALDLEKIPAGFRGRFIKGWMLRLAVPDEAA